MALSWQLFNDLLRQLGPRGAESLVLALAIVLGYMLATLAVWERGK